MEDGRELLLHIHLLDPDEISPDEFLRLIQMAESLTRHVFEQEAQDLLEYLRLPEEWRFDSIKRIRSLGRRVAVPAELRSVERGSWMITVAVTGSVVVFALKNYLHPVVKEAWDESELRKRLVEFVQGRIFRKASREVTNKAADIGKKGSLEIVGVEGPVDDEAPIQEVTVRVEKRQIIEVTLSDRDLIEQFLQQLKKD